MQNVSMVTLLVNPFHYFPLYLTLALISFALTPRLLFKIFRVMTPNFMSEQLDEEIALFWKIFFHLDIEVFFDFLLMGIQC